MSYYKEYLRNESVNKLYKTGNKLMTDRSSYMSYLELQLERVSNSLLIVHLSLKGRPILHYSIMESSDWKMQHRSR